MKPHHIALAGAILITLGAITLLLSWRIGLIDPLDDKKELNCWQKAFIKTGIGLLILGFSLEGISFILGP